MGGLLSMVERTLFVISLFAEKFKEKQLSISEKNTRPKLNGKRDTAAHKEKNINIFLLWMTQQKFVLIKAKS